MAHSHSLDRLLNATRYSLLGFREELLIAAVLAPIALYIGDSATGRVGTEQHELSDRTKDLGSAAVFVALALVVAVWGIVIAERVANFT